MRLGSNVRLRLPWRLFTALITGLLLLIVPSAYWAYANYLPALAQPEFETPYPNGYEVALKAIESGGRSREGFDLPWGGNGSAFSLRHLPFQTPPEPAYFAVPDMREPLTAVRKTFALKWRVPHPESRSDDATRMFTYTAHAFAAESRWRTDHADWNAGLSSAVDAIELGSKVCKFGAIRDRILGQSCQNIGLTEIERIYGKLPGPAIATALRESGDCDMSGRQSPKVSKSSGRLGLARSMSRFRASRERVRLRSTHQPLTFNQRSPA